MKQYARLLRNSVDGHHGSEVALRSVRRAPGAARAATTLGEHIHLQQINSTSVPYGVGLRLGAGSK